MSRGRIRRRRAIAGLAFAAALAAGLGSPAARADPRAGEGRSILRDLDHPTTVVAGEADGAATVMNPGNLGFLRDLSGVIEGSAVGAAASRRGSGAGSFLGAPIGAGALGVAPFLALGFGYQLLWPGRTPGRSGDPILDSSDLHYHKATLSLAVPLMRWAPGLSVGVAYSRLFSRGNAYASGAQAVDLALAYRPHEVIALGLVARGVNLARSGPEGARVVQPVILDPEVALRPLRRADLELAVGARIAPVLPDVARFAPARVQPRARLQAGHAGVLAFAEVELLRMHAAAGGASPGLRWIAGLSLDLPRVGVAGGATGGLGALAGGAGRLRLSRERHAGPPLPPREALEVRLAGVRGDRALYAWIERLEACPPGQVVLVRTAGLGLGWAQLEELREALERHQARGGRVAVYLEGASLGAYYLASAADHVLAHPERQLAIVGISAEVFYFAELLEKLGARADFVRIGAYKARPETYADRTASEPVARQRLLHLGDVFDAVVATIADGRGASIAEVEAWIDDAPLGPEEARARGLVDALVLPDGLEAALGAWLGRTTRIRAPSRRPEHDGAFGPGRAIAVLHVDGVLSQGASFKVPLVGQKIAGADTITAAIDALTGDPRVKAVVVRVDSIGGSVAAASAIAHALDRVAADKPVIVSFGNVAASGGYYVATAGAVIFSDALTTTGSIGIFRPKVDLSGLLARLGVGVDRVSFGAVAGIGSWFKPYSDRERRAAYEGIEASYRIFTGRVAAARDMPRGVVEEVARGRVWSGARALTVGLADFDGGLHDAIAYARAEVGLDARQGAVIHVPAPPGLAGQAKALTRIRLPFGSGSAGGAWGADDADEAGEAALAGPALAVLAPVLPLLRRLPVNLWLLPEEGELAMMDVAFASSI